MQRYIGTKIINAEPMNRQKYNDFRGWALPENEDGMDAGYLVEYTDGGTPNTEKFEGYVSWSPKEQFDKAYKENGALTFGLALEAMKSGLKIARQGWNGKGMFVYYVPASSYAATTIAAKEYFNGPVPYNAYMAIKNTDDTVSTWVPSVNDCLSEDWVIVE